MTQFKGIDVSHYQGNIDFGKVKAAGYGFVIAKATEGSEAGSRYLDPNFKKNVTAAKVAGINVHAYHFFRGISESDARAEADWLLKNLTGNEEYLFCDVEAQNLNSDPAKLTAFVNAFFDQLAKAGHTELGVYSGLYFMKDRLIESQLRPGLLKWIAQYNSTFDRTADVWQHTSSASVPGIAGNVDENYAYTDKLVSAGAPAASVKPAVKPSPAPHPAAQDTYIIKSGDTLSQIGARFGIDYHQIKAWNGLTSDTIYPGQVLRLKAIASKPASIPSGSGTYTVKAGDTLSGIGAKFGVDYHAIKSLNGLKSDTIYPGQVFKIPGTTSKPAARPVHGVVSGDTLWGISQANHTTVQALKNINHLSNDTIYPGQKIYLK